MGITRLLIRTMGFVKKNTLCVYFCTVSLLLWNFIIIAVCTNDDVVLCKNKNCILLFVHDSVTVLFIIFWWYTFMDLLQRVYMNSIHNLDVKFCDFIWVQPLCVDLSELEKMIYFMMENHLSIIDTTMPRCE